MLPADLELFSLIAGGVSLLAVLILVFAVILLCLSVKKLKRQVNMLTRREQHSFYNPAIQPEEELAKRGYSMYNGQVEERRASTQEKELNFASFD
ncbi:hypothetical protein C0J52_01787 [Blattella germanica]|nr:hypothetical protein C0J52_01787 [Blattella germanica]